MPFDVPPFVLGTLAVAVIAVAVTPIWWGATAYLMSLFDIGARYAVGAATGVRIKAVLFWGRNRDGRFAGGLLAERGWWLNKLLVGLVGVPAPSVAGLVAARGVDVGWHPRTVFLVLLVVAAVPFVYNRSWLMLLLSAAVVGALLLFAFFASPSTQGPLLVLVAWLLLLGGFRWSAEMAAGYGDADSRPQYLSALTDVPAAVWAFGFVVVSLGALVAGARWLLGV